MAELIMTFYIFKRLNEKYTIHNMCVIQHTVRTPKQVCTYDCIKYTNIKCASDEMQSIIINKS